MIAILTQKRGVALAIARILDIPAEEKDGCLEGENYLIIRIGAGLLEPLIPEEDHVRESNAVYPDHLPPALVPRRIKTEKGYRTDKEAVRQLKVIRQVFCRCERIIVATAPSDRGELAFRYLYRYLESTVPFSRLWLTALTDTAIRRELENLRNGRLYDHLFAAADARRWADKLMEVYVGGAMREATGGAEHYPGRLQTPLLALICKHHLDGGHLKATPCWQATLTLRKGDAHFRAQAAKLFSDEQQAEELYNRIKAHPQARIEHVEHGERKIHPPLPFDLAALQKEAGTRFSMRAAQVLDAAHALYEAGLISWPETTNRRIPRDLFKGIPARIEALKAYPPLAKQAVLMSAVRANTHSIDRKHTTGHHAIITTGNIPEKLTPSQETVYRLVAARMLEAFAPATLLLQTSIGIDCAGAAFSIERSHLRKTGGYGLFATGQEEIYTKGNRNKDGDGHGHKNGYLYGKQKEELPPLEQGESLSVPGCSLARRSAKGQHLLTETSLLEAMETAGGSGIGTPQERAVLIGSLVSEGYIHRQGKAIVPTRKGLDFYDKVKTLDIASVEKAARWEKKLGKIEQEPQRYDACMEGIRRQAMRAADEVKSVCALQGEKTETPYICPRCKLGKITFFQQVVKCTYSRCNLTLPRQVSDHRLTDRQLTALFKTGRSALVRGFKDKAGETSDGYLLLDKNGNLHFDRAEGKGRKEA